MTRDVVKATIYGSLGLEREENGQPINAIVLSPS